MKAKVGLFKPKLNTITPNWLKVDSAIIFFISNSKKAENLAMNIVETPTALINKLLMKENLFKCRINTYTPAVTNVEEWTKEDTGVGAAIAAGSHAEKGICALLVKAPRTKRKIRPLWSPQRFLYQKKLKSPKGT